MQRVGVLFVAGARASISHGARWAPRMSIWLGCRRFVASCL